MNDTQMESWYDKTFDMIVMLLIELDNNSITTEIKSTINTCKNPAPKANLKNSKLSFHR